MQKINYIKASQITSTDGLARFCIFQNASSTFARFIGEAKGDIRISQLNTVIRLYFLLTIILRSCRRLHSPTYYSSTASGPPSLAREGYKKQKMPRFCETLHIYSFVAHVRTASSVLRTCAPLTVSRHGAICTRSLVSELTDSLRLIIKRFCLDQRCILSHLSNAH